MQRDEVRVTMADGTEHRVTITNRAEVAFEREAALRQWPTKDNENLANTYKAWFELAKLTKVLDCTYSDFENTLCLEVAPYISETRLEAMVAEGKMPTFLADEMRADGLVVAAEVVADPTPQAPPPDGPLT